jgi:hypothetical protein
MPSAESVPAARRRVPARAPIVRRHPIYTVGRGAAAAGDGGSVLAAYQQQPGGLDVDVDITASRGDWWADPVWIGLGIVALILLIVIVALIARGGGTTIIKE